MKRLINLKYKEWCSITKQTSESHGFVDQLTIMNIIPDDELQVLLLFNFLPDRWETLVVLVNNSAPNKKLTVDTVTDRLRNEASRKKSAEVVPSELNALVSEK